MLLAASVPDVCNSFVSDAIRIFEIKAGSHVTVEQVCRELNITPVKLTRLFKQHTNLTPKQYLISMRMKNAETLLRASMKSVKEIAFLSGYSSPQKFCREFAKFHNLSPRQYRKFAASAQERCKFRSPCSRKGKQGKGYSRVISALWPPVPHCNGNRGRGFSRLRFQVRASPPH